MADFSMESVRNVDWAKDYLWDCRLIDRSNSGPGQFTNWFPATTVNENLATTQSFTFEAYLSSYSVPQSTSETTVDISFIDDSEHSIKHWISDWVNKDIFGEGKFVRTAHECVRYLQVRMLDTQRKPTKETVYMVIPDGDLNFSGTSESGSHENTISFKVLGILSQTKK